LQPHDPYLAKQKIDLLLTQGKTTEARAVLRELPADDSFSAAAREAPIVFLEGGPDAMKAWLAERKIASKATTGIEFAALARMQFLANDWAAARATLAHADRFPLSSSAAMFDGSQIRFEYSAALTRASIELRGGGDSIKALKILKDLDHMLDRYEENGGEHFSLYSLRAESLALQGKSREAQAALNTAWKKGWRATLRARHEPNLAGLEIPN
jgi:hypothetical protein